MLTLNFNPFPELKTERLLLRRLKKEDAPEIFALRSDPRVLEYIHKEPCASITEAEEFIGRIETAILSNESILWGIAPLDALDKLIGTICLWQIRKEDYRAEIGYALQTDHWRKGIMKEAMHRVIDYGFKEMGLHSIDAAVTGGNIASGAALEATGFVKEAHFRESVCFRGKFYDMIMYARFQ